MYEIKKKIGFGSLALLLCFGGILSIFSFGEAGCFGDSIIRFLGLKPWSKGTTGVHYTIYYSLIIFATSILLGFKFKEDLGASLGRKIAFGIFLFISLSVFTLVV